MQTIHPMLWFDEKPEVLDDPDPDQAAEYVRTLPPKAPEARRPMSR